MRKIKEFIMLRVFPAVFVFGLVVLLLAALALGIIGFIAMTVTLWRVIV